MADKTPYFACGCIQCGVMGDGTCGAVVENLEGDIMSRYYCSGFDIHNAFGNGLGEMPSRVIL